MEIDLNKHHIEVAINNIDMEKVYVKLPATEESLEYALLRKNIAHKNGLGYLKFDPNIKSVLAIKRVESLKINKPTNIYYLNAYLNILKNKGISINTDKQEEISTKVLQEKIACLLDIDDHKITYDEIISLLDPVEESRDKKKPVFTMMKINKRHQEKKRNERKLTDE